MKPMTRKEEKRKRARKQLLSEAIDLAAEHRIPRSRGLDPVNTAKVMDEVASRTLQLFRWAAENADNTDADDFWVDGVDKDGNPITQPNKWYQIEAALREEMFDMASRMAGLDIDDRRVRVEEAQMEVLGRALKQSMKDAQIPEEQQRAIGSALRTNLALIQGQIEPPETKATLPPDYDIEAAA